MAAIAPPDWPLGRRPIPRSSTTKNARRFTDSTINASETEQALVRQIVDCEGANYLLAQSKTAYLNKQLANGPVFDRTNNAYEALARSRTMATMRLG